MAASTFLHHVRRYANLVNLSTPLGLVIARAGGARVRPGPRGLVLADHYRPRFPRASAFTVGNVLITASDFDLLAQWRPGLLAHEERHTWQWLACLGLPFLPLYGLAMAWSLLRTGSRAEANPFERAAGLKSGGYGAGKTPRQRGSKPRRRAERAR